jgi:3-dehydroquinate synthase
MKIQYQFSRDANIIFAKDMVCQVLSEESIRSIDRSAPVFVITDANVETLYGELFQSSLEKKGLTVYRFVSQVGEVAKSIQTLDQAFSFCIERGIKRQSTVIALGGGVIGNLAGMLAATVYRGVNFISIPTTLLSQTDAAIDFKQALNTTHGKNLIGTYYPPSTIIIDTALLKSLDQRFLVDGLAEGLKHGLCHDKEFIQEFVSRPQDLRDPAFLDWFVSQTVENKVKTMGSSGKSPRDEAIKQYGHSIGHAIEHLNYPDCLHGEAIAIGMVCSAMIGARLNVGAPGLVQIYKKLFTSVGLPIHVPSREQVPEIMEVMKVDKYNLNGLPTMGLVQELGRMADGNTPSGFTINWELVEQVLRENVSPNEKV